MRTIGDFLMGDPLAMAVPHRVLRRRFKLPEGAEYDLSNFRAFFAYSMHLRAYRTSQPAPSTAELAVWLSTSEDKVEAALAQVRAAGWLKDIAAEERTLVLRHLYNEGDTRARCPWCSGDLRDVRTTAAGPRCGECLGLAITEHSSGSRITRSPSRVPNERLVR